MRVSGKLKSWSERRRIVVERDFDTYKKHRRKVIGEESNEERWIEISSIEIEEGKVPHGERVKQW